MDKETKKALSDICEEMLQALFAMHRQLFIELASEITRGMMDPTILSSDPLAMVKLKSLMMEDEVRRKAAEDIVKDRLRALASLKFFYEGKTDGEMEEYLAKQYQSSFEIVKKASANAVQELNRLIKNAGG